jgi:hypothetical protein
MLHLREVSYRNGLRADVDSYVEANSFIYPPVRSWANKAQEKLFADKEKAFLVPAQSPSLLDQEASRWLCRLWFSSPQHLERTRRREVIPRWPARTKTGTQGSGKHSRFEGIQRWLAFGTKELAGLGGDARRRNSCLPVDSNFLIIIKFFAWSWLCLFKMKLILSLSLSLEWDPNRLRCCVQNEKDLKIKLWLKTRIFT